MTEEMIDLSSMNIEDLPKKFEITVVPVKRVHPPEHIEYKDFGIFAVDVIESERWDLMQKNKYGNYSLKGGMPDLEIGKKYIALVEREDDEKYGAGYRVDIIYMKLYTTIEEQKIFLQEILTEHQVKSLFEAYPDMNVVDLIKNDQLDTSLTRGIGEKTLQKIKEKIIMNEKYQRAIIELSGEYGISYNAVKRLSDKYGSPDMLIEKIKENPYILTEFDGFGFKKVDEIALNLGIEKNSKYRILACAEYILKQKAEEGHSWVKLTKLINESIKLLSISIFEIKSVLTDEGNMTYYHIDDGKIYLKKNKFYEEQIKYHMLRILNAHFEHKITNYDVVIQKVEENQGFKFTDEQLRAIHFAVKYNIVIVNGKAGTGKTSVIKGIVEVLRMIDNLMYATCALSGKASQRIQESTGLESFTIHRLYGYNPNMGWTFNENNPLERDVIILDEASMINSELFYYTVRAVKDGAKLIIAGDTAQLEPIGVGNVLVDLLASNIIPKVELTIVHRQAQKSGILSSANLVREGKRFIDDVEVGNTYRIGELEDLYLYPYNDDKKIFNKVINIAKRYNGDILDFQIIVPMKKRGANSAKKINEACQKILNRDPEFTDDKEKIVRNDVVFLEGDKVIQNGNNYNKKLYNGTIGIIKYIDSTYVEKGQVVGEIVIDFEGIGEVRLNKSEMANIDLAYAITVHKSQGSQWKYVVFAMDYSSYILLSRQLAYTGMTRASKGLFLVVELKALNYSIDTDKSIKRNTFLPELLEAV